MKNMFSLVIGLTAILIAACNNNPTSTADHSKMNHADSMPMQPADADKDIKAVSISFASVDPGVAAFMNSLVTNYLVVKNALVENDESTASSAANKIEAVMKNLDKSLFTAEQKKVYDDVQDDLKEHAGHIAENKLDHQRKHFSMMSEDVYSLVKAFGAGTTLYHDHCPMAMENKGAMWLSETKNIRNPYYGDKMMTCGTVEEMFQ